MQLKMELSITQKRGTTENRRRQHAAEDVDGIKTVADLIPSALKAIMDAAAARSEKRLRALRALHQRTRASETESKGGSR